MYCSRTSGADAMRFSADAVIPDLESRLPRICSRFLPQQLIVVFLHEKMFGFVDSSLRIFPAGMPLRTTTARPAASPTDCV